MNPATITLTFVMIWWLTFFILLPIGVTRENDPQLGNAPGAPKNTYLLKKVLGATLTAIILTTGFFFFLQHGYLDFLSPRS